MKTFLKKLPFAQSAVRWARSLGTGSRSPHDKELTHAGVTRHAANQRRAEDFALVRVEWRDQGPTPFLADRARSATRNTVAWDALHPRMWLVYCAVLIEAGDLDYAERLLRTYVARGRSVDQLSQCLPVARFATTIGIRTPAVERAAATGNVLAANLEADVFAKLVAGKSVAVVGNGPGPLGKGLGDEIDSHDLVIRFNNYPSGYEADYGARTDIWVRGSHKDVRDRFDIERFKLVVWEMDLFRNLLEAPSHGDILYRDTQFSPENVTHIGTATKRALWERSGLVLPTSGAQTIWMLHEALGSLKNVDVYGFSEIDGGDHGHFYDSLGDMGKRHDVTGEGAFLRSLIAEGRAGDVDGAATPAPPNGDIVVVSCAYREYDPSSGKTGGPGGVLATQQIALNAVSEGYSQEYRFRGRNHDALATQAKVQTAGLSAKVTDIILGAEAIRSDPAFLAARDEGRRMLFVCHELGTAYGAYLLGMPYVLVYHQQGSTLQEMRSVGRVPTPHEVNVANRLERLVLENARKVYFPSIGARETYKATSEVGDSEAIHYAEWALYNTVSAVDHAEGGGRDIDIRQVMRRIHLPEKAPDTDVFISVGDFNEDKGLDRVPALLQRHASLSGRRVIWIAVGAGGGSPQFAALRAAQSEWNFTAHLIGERMSHDQLLALLDYADYYVMMHRNSIFDLAILEAMRAAKPLILSPVGGNVEVDLDGNVLFVDEDTIDDACRVIESRDRENWGERCRQVFEQNFSLERFAERYRQMINEQIEQLQRDRVPV